MVLKSDSGSRRKVSLVRCETYESPYIDSAIGHAVDLIGGMARFVKPGNRVLIKPNLLSADPPERRITTDPQIVRAVTKAVIACGGTPLIGDSPGIAPFKRVATRTGMAGVARDLDIQLAELNSPTPVSLPEGAVFRQLEIASQALEADVVINLPKLKTHSQMLLTLGVKNLFGTIVAQRKAEWHHMAGVSRETFASLLLDIYQAVRPALTILDGVWGMEGLGPSNGRPRRINLIAASEDSVALDVTVCHLLGVPPRAFPIYRTARARGIGETDVRKIRLLGEPLESFPPPNFQIPSLDSMGLLPERFDWFTKRFLVSKPVRDARLCTECGHCAQVCPAEAISAKRKNIGFDYHRCIRCYCCQEICPQDAIYFRKGLLVRLLTRLRR
jgi:uncharacterized protein (DUF362 family)/Pyruvate/2-oxoacid:ferredoxin oxidoreductase delta subunit